MTFTPTQHRGVSDFLRFADSVIYPKWAMVMVKAPLEEVIKYYQPFSNGEISQNIPIETVSNGDFKEPLWQSITLVQLLNSSWTVVYRSIMDCLYGDALSLSQELGTEAIDFSGEDVADAIQYQYFARGDQIEFAAFSKWGEVLTFESPNRSQPELELIEDDVFPEEEEGELPEPSHNQGLLYNFLDDLLGEQDIYIPICYPVDEEGETQLIAWERSANTVASASVVHSD